MAERPAVVRERRDVRAARLRPRRARARARRPPGRSATGGRSAPAGRCPSRTRRSSGCRRACRPGSARRRRARPPTAGRPSCTAPPRRCPRRRAPSAARRGPCCRTAPRRGRSGRVELHRPEVGVAHRAERRREAPPAHLRALAADLELLEAVLVAHEPQRPVAVLRLEVGLPQVGRLEDVAVGVDRAGERQRLVACMGFGMFTNVRCGRTGSLRSRAGSRRRGTDATPVPARPRRRCSETGWPTPSGE